MSVDPLATDYAAWSGYNYVLGNPLVFVDPDGKSPDWIDLGDGSYKAEDGDSAWSLHQQIGISAERADEIVQCQYGLNYTGADGELKSNIDSGDIVDVNSGEIKEKAKDIEIQQIGKRLDKSIAEDSKLARKESQLDSNISDALNALGGASADGLDQGGKGAAISISEYVLKPLRHERTTVINSRDSIKDLIKKRQDSIKQIQSTRQND